MTNHDQMIEPPVRHVGDSEEQKGLTPRTLQRQGQRDDVAAQQGLSRRHLLAGGAGVMAALAGGSVLGRAAEAHAAATGAETGAAGLVAGSASVASTGLAQPRSSDMVMKIGVTMPGIGDTVALSLSYGMGNTPDPARLSGEKTTVADVSIIKEWDATSVGLMLSCAGGRRIREVVFSVPAPNGKQDTITLLDVQVSSFVQRSASVDELNAFEIPLLELVSFRYAKIGIDIAGIRGTYTVG